MNELSRKSVKIVQCIVGLHDKSTHGLFQCEVRHRLEASRLFHDELSSFDLSMNIGRGEPGEVRHQMSRFTHSWRALIIKIPVKRLDWR